MSARAAGWLTAALLLSVPAAAPAQYFGANKVQYQRLDFRVLKTEHFDVYFYPSEREGAEIAARMAERWYTRLSGVFDHRLRGRQPLVLYASHSDFEQNNIIADNIGEGTGGVTEPVKRRIVLPLAGPLADTDHVLGHELVHAFQFDLTARGEGSQAGTALARLPLWFVEGMAEYLSLGPVDAQTAMWLRDTAWQETLPTIHQLDSAKYFPYRWGHAFWAYVGGRWGDHVILKMLMSAAANGDVDRAIAHVLGVTHTQLADDWRTSIRSAYTPVLASATPPSHVGRTLIEGHGDMNVGPALSPDGRRLAFLSQRNYLAVDLFVADAATGHVVRKLTSGATDPHYSSLQFIASAGAWDASSRRLAVAVVTAGRPALAIFDGQTGRREREIPITDVDEVFNPTWAPDGHAIGFTAMTQGVTDLFVYDFSAGTVRRLTNDPYADLQPSWSPDGRLIAFTTDRFTSDVSTLAMGAFRLALLDPATGAIQPVPAFDEGKQINPHWSADGASLIFIADHDGIANLYRAPYLGGQPEQLTSISTGISGITASSPAVSVASSAGVAAMTVYQRGGYSIHLLENGALGGRALEPAQGATASLPPLDRQPSDVGAMLADARRGLLPPMPSARVEPYRPRLSPESIGQAEVGIGVSRFGTAVGGGVALTFSDMLNTHLLSTAFNINASITGSTSYQDIGAQAAYMNQRRRWNWGVGGGQVPYVGGGVQSGLGRYNGEPAEIDQIVLYRQVERSAVGVAAYPFDRARRVEFTAGVTHIGFETITRTDVYSLSSGASIYRDTSTTSLAAPLTLATSAAAVVSDTSTFGATSPVAGARFRLEAAPTFGTVRYTGVLGDYRRYLMPVPFYTLAARVMHYGRYGTGGTDVRLSPLYLGYMALVRGYDVNGFDASECQPVAASSCPAFDRLVGNRMLVGNLEFRFPLLRPFGVSQRMYGPVPMEIGVFTDGGVAWNPGESPAMFGGARKGVSSAGVTFRVNIFGTAVAQIDAARPFQRPAAGWVFQFNLIPGF